MDEEIVQLLILLKFIKLKAGNASLTEQMTWHFEKISQE